MRFLFLALLAVITTPVQADVVHGSAHGFVIEHETHVMVHRERVYQALVHEVGKWWSSDHTYSGDASHLSIDDRAGGCFCERWPKGQVQHMQVVFVRHGETLRMTGGLGPLQLEAATGSMTWQLDSQEDGSTRIQLDYKVTGYRPDGMETWAPAVDQVLSGQVQNLARYLTNTKGQKQAVNSH